MLEVERRRQFPEIEERIESGELNLTLVSQASQFFRREEVSQPEEKRQMLDALAGKSTREAERELVSRSKEPEKLIPEKIRPISAEYSELKMIVDQRLLAEIEELKGLLGHKLPGASLTDLVRYAVELTLKKHRPKAPKSLRPQFQFRRRKWNRGGRCA